MADQKVLLVQAKNDLQATIPPAAPSANIA
jgi:hypothetical protein